MSARLRHTGDRSLVGFRVGDVRYALPVLAVREVVRPLPVVALPHPPPAVLGVADYRGAIVPVVDLRARFGVRPPETPGAKWVVARAHARHVALVVDQVTDVFGSGEQLREPPPLGPEVDALSIVGVVARATGLVFVLDPEALAALAEGVVERAAAERP